MRKVIIMGAGGRDFHNFNVVYRDDPETEVVAFTAAQIPGIDDRRYPASLAGPRYPDGIPIVPEAELAALVQSEEVDEVVLAYSDLSHAGGDAQGVGRARSGRRLQAARARRDDAAQLEAGRCGLRRPHRQRQEPDEPPDRAAPARRRAQGGPRAASDAVRRPRADARAALRDAGRHRRLRPDRRGARGVRAPGRARDGDVRGRRLRRHPRAGPGRGRRDRLGRRQQRLPVLPPRPADHGGRPAQGRARAHATTRARRTCAWRTSSSSTRSTAPTPDVDRARARGHRGGQPARDRGARRVAGDARRRARPSPERPCS